jgi:hypothetical protein
VDNLVRIGSLIIGNAAHMNIGAAMQPSWVFPFRLLICSMLRKLDFKISYAVALAQRHGHFEFTHLCMM